MDCRPLYPARKPYCLLDLYLHCLFKATSARLIALGRLRVAGLCIITKEVLNPFPSFILHIYYNKKIEKNQILLLNAPRGNRTPISRSVAARSLHYPTGAKQDTSTALQTI